MSAEKLVEGLYEWAQKHVDLWDWAHEQLQWGSASRFTGPTITQVELGLTGKRRPSLLRRYVQAHLASPLPFDASEAPGWMLHYRPRRSASVVPVMLDVDAAEKDGAIDREDALQVAMLARSLFPGSHLEHSTHGRGWHLYVHLAMQAMPRSQFNELMRQLARALSALSIDQGHKARIEVKGTFTLLTPDGKHVMKRGTCAKLPRLPKGAVDLESLLSSPIFHLGHVERLIQQAPDRPAPPRKRRPAIDWAHELARVPDAFVRMREAGMRLARTLGRVPTEEELVSFYERHHLHTGDDNGGRAVRATKVIRWLLDTFDPSKCGGFTSRLPALLEMIRSQVQEEDRREVSYPGRIMDEDLAITLYVVERGSFRGEFGCAGTSIERMFEVLHAAGVTKRTCKDRKKVASMKRILESAGLIVCSDPRYRFGSYGHKAKSYTIGPAHPRHAEFLSRTADCVGAG